MVTNTRIYYFTGIKGIRVFELIIRYLIPTLRDLYGPYRVFT